MVSVTQWLTNVRALISACPPISSVTVWGQHRWLQRPAGRTVYSFAVWKEERLSGKTG